MCLGDISPRDSLSFDVCKWLLMSLSPVGTVLVSRLSTAKRLQHFCSSKQVSRHYLKGPCRRPWNGIYYFLLHRWDSCGIYDVRQWLILVSNRCDVKYELRAPELMTAQILIGSEFFGNCFRFSRFWFLPATTVCLILGGLTTFRMSALPLAFGLLAFWHLFSFSFRSGWHFKRDNKFYCISSEEPPGRVPGDSRDLIIWFAI